MPDYRYVVREPFHDPENGKFYQRGDMIDVSDHDKLNEDHHLDRFCTRHVAQKTGPQLLEAA